MTADTHGDGALHVPEGVALLEAAALPDGARVAIVASRYHSQVVQRLLEGACEVVRTQLGEGAADVLPVPGAFELGLAARGAARSGRYAAVVALGCVIRGDTPHFDYVCSEAARGITLAALETGVPVGFGVLTVENADQAFERAGGSAGNKGAEAARAALDLARTLYGLDTVAIAEPSGS